MKKTNKLDIKTITLMAMLTAISIILTRFLSIDILNKTTRIGFGSTPIIFSGVFLGPVAGGIVGALSDLLGMFIAPSGPYHPGLTVSSALTGIIPGLIAYFMPKKRLV